MTSRPVEITHRERLVFPDAGYTKGDLADYYSAIAPLILPFMAGRPVSLLRCPQGRDRNCFFQKHGGPGFGPPVHTIAIEEKSGETADYLYVEDEGGILQCVQMGAIEFHGWASLCSALEQPDRLVFDLDPGEGLGFAEVKRAAVDVRERLAEEGLRSFALLTGGKGVHVLVPLSPGHSWDSHSGFARRIAHELAGAGPDRFTATMSKEKRKGRIFVDWLRNARGATAIMPYSARARIGAPVAVPVSWDELDGFGQAGAFTVGDIGTLKKRAGSGALKGWGEAGQKLP